MGHYDHGSAEDRQWSFNQMDAQTRDKYAQPQAGQDTRAGIAMKSKGRRHNQSDYQDAENHQSTVNPLGVAESSNQARLPDPNENRWHQAMHYAKRRACCSKDIFGV